MEFTGSITEGMVRLDCGGESLIIPASCTLAIGHFIVGRIKAGGGVELSKVESEFNPLKLQDEVKVLEQIKHVERKMGK